MQRLHGDIPDHKGTYAGPAPIDNYIVFNIYTLGPACFILRILTIRVVLQRYGAIGD